MTHVEELIADLKDSVREAKLKPSGTGTMVTLYGTPRFSHSFHFVEYLAQPCTLLFTPILFVGLGKSNAVGPTMVGHLATAFLDALYKA